MGYLHAQFLSPHVNRRDDAYGGSAAVVDGSWRRPFEPSGPRSATDRPSAFASFPTTTTRGLELDDSVEQCVAIAGAGLCDFINVAVGNTSTLAGVPSIVPSMYTRPERACRRPGRCERRSAKPV